MKKLIEKTEEEMIKSFEDNNNLEFISEPNRFFKVGELVEIGNLKDCIIVKSLFGGKVYLIGYTEINNNYGNPIITKGIRGIWNWLSIFPKTNNKNSFIKNEDLELNYSQTQMGGIISKVYHFGVEMNPEYQRGYVWSREDKENLIESIFNNIDIGKFVFVCLPFKSNSPTYEILDGKQRVNAIKEFYEDKLLFNGLKFSELSIRDRYHFTNYHVNIAELKNCDLQMKLRVFYHLNISGKVMDKEHLEKVKNMLEEK